MIKKALIIFTLLILILGIVINGYSTPTHNPDPEGMQLIIQFKQGSTIERITEIHEMMGATLIKRDDTANIHLIQIQDDQPVYDICKAYEQFSIVDYCEPNDNVYACMIPNDEDYTYQWHLHESSHGGIQVEPAWNISTGAGVIVAVIDTGISKGTDLQETDFVQGYDFVNDDADPSDDEGHGTHVAGTIAQSTDNSIGVCGVAFNATLMPVKVLNDDGSGTVYDLAQGIYYAVDHDADIISLSLGSSSPHSSIEDAVQYAYRHNVTVIAAAGNKNGAIHYPAAYDKYVIAVGATRYDKIKAPYSNYGDSLDIVAPGGDLDKDQNNDGHPDGVLQQTVAGDTWGYYFYQGTSMATPHVSGVAALIHAVNITHPDSIRAVLESTSIDLGNSGWDPYYGHGLVNAYDAVMLATTNDPPTANFTLQKQGLHVVLTDTCTDNETMIANWSWDFGDSSQSFQQHPQHLYQSAGTYQIQLTVTDMLGSTNQTVQEITVVNNLPQVNFSYFPSEQYTFQKVVFIDNSSDRDGSVVNWTWDFGDGNTSYDSQTSHRYREDGLYTVNLIIADNSGGINETQHTISILNQAPQISYRIESNNGSTADTITFYDQSTDADGSVMNWTWDFGDGTRKYQQHTSHQYEDDGSYIVTFQIRDNDHTTNSTSVQLNITNQHPIAQYLVTPVHPTRNDQISFTDQSTDADGSVVNWTWDFGDENTSYQQHPIHQYQHLGIYQVTLIVTDDDDSVNSIHQNITVQNIDPEANFSIIAETYAALEDIMFNDSSIDLDGNIVNWSWDFGDGTTGFGPNITHQFNDDRIYNITLNVTDIDGGFDVCTQYITINNTDPLADFYWEPEQPTTQQQVVFLDQSLDIDGSIQNWTWDFGDGNQSFSHHASHMYEEQGWYYVTLVVYDDQNASSSTFRQIQIMNMKPVADFTYAPDQPLVDEDVIFTDASSDDGDVVEWMWDFGDGTRNDSQHPVHTYSRGGSFTVTLTVVDDDGDNHSVAYPIMVDDDQQTSEPPGTSGGGDGSGGSVRYVAPVNRKPVASISCTTYNGTVHKPCIVYGWNSTDSDGFIVNWTWDFGNQTLKYGDIQNHTYHQPGTYEIHLTVTDDKGDSDTQSILMFIDPVNRAPFKPIVAPSKNNTDESFTHCYSVTCIDVDGDDICFDVDWGDGSTETSAFTMNASVLNLCHTWNEPGYYQISIQSRDPSNVSSNKTSFYVCVNTTILYIDSLTEGYCLDIGCDGIYDVYHDTISNVTTAIGSSPMGQDFLIDSDQDGAWDVAVQTDGQVRKYQGEVQGHDVEDESYEDFLVSWGILGMLILFLMCLIGWILIRK